MLKKEFILKNLDCAHCAGMIEDNVNKLDYIDKAVLNFVNQTLTLSYIGVQNNILDDIKKIVNKLEPDVIVSEKKENDKSVSKEYILEGLDCAHCAGMIEENINKLDYIDSAVLNFVNQTLSVSLKNEQSDNKIFNDIKNIVNKLEPDVTVKEKTLSKKEIQQNDTKISKSRIATFSIGAILFAIPLIFSFDKNIEFLFYFTSYIFVGGKVLFKALKNITRGQIFDENFLMAIATVGAFAIGEYAEGVAVMIFYQIGEFFQDMAVNNSRRSIKDLMNIRPDYANLIVDEKEETNIVSPYDVSEGDLILIKPGEKIPLDSIVVKGSSSIDTVALTGESVPRSANIGDTLLSGTVNLNGLLTAKVLKPFEESTANKILNLVENASSKKSTTENFITVFAKYYTPIVVGLAVLIATVIPLVSGQSFSIWISRALVFLVVSCPCALVISIPLGFFGGIGAASKNGILVKGSNYLEALFKADTIVMDKTGTLTKGVFKVTKISPQNNFSEDELLKYTAYAENYSSHPIAVSIKNTFKDTIDETKIKDYNDFAGQGISAYIENKKVLAGNSKLMANNNINFENTDSSGTTVHVAIDGNYAGYIVISDEIKEDSKTAITELHNIGIKEIIMLTGDNKNVANKVASDLGVDRVYSELLPDKKVEILEDILMTKEKNEKVVFVGDGINDAPVLSRADVGIAMGGLGSDAAIEASDIVLMTDEPYKLVTAINISKETRKIVYQNIFFALSVKLIVLVLSLFGKSTMWAAVFADVGVALIAIFNSMRILKFKN